MAQVPLDGRMTSFQPVPATLQGDELFWLVQPGNVQFGVLYNGTLDAIAAYITGFPGGSRIVITDGATSGSPYSVPTTAAQILFNKTVSSPSFAVCPSAGTVVYPKGITFKDLKGDAGTDPITITFTGGQLCDGLDTITITASYGWVTLYPAPGGTAWYMGP